MKRRAFFLALATAAAVVWGSGATNEARAAGVPLSTVLGTTQSFGGLNFTFPSLANNGYSTVNGPAADQVNIVFQTVTGPGGVTEIGFELQAPFGAQAGQRADSALNYTVTATDGLRISDALLTANPFTTGSGFGSVTELFNGTTIIGVQSPAPLTTTFNFNPTLTTLTVAKDIEANAIGSSAPVSLSLVGQYFSVVPEPASMSLLGIGMAGLLAFRRYFKRAATV